MAWIEENNELVREFAFANFMEAFAFLSKVAILAEKHNHHPHIENIYNRVIVRLSTHDEGNQVTDKDRALAQEIDKALNSFA